MLNKNPKNNKNNDKKDNKEREKEKKTLIINIIVCLIVLIFGVIMFSANNSPNQKIDDMPEILYSEFLTYVNENQVDTVWYSQEDEYMRFVLFTDETKNMTKKERDKYEYPKDSYIKCLYPGSDSGFRKDMLLSDVNLVIDSYSAASIVNVITTIFSVLINLALLTSMLMLVKVTLKSVGGDTTIQVSENVDTKFDDVIGHNEVIEDIRFIINLLKNPEIGENTNAKIPKGLLFSGPPGTGKTLIARAMAGEAEVPFIYMNASSFIEMYVGLGAKRVRTLFKKARECSPCIVFIDEIDAIGQKRNSSRSSSSEDTQTINALLQEMDGFDPSTGILVIAATNCPDTLDEALTRSGRFDREIVISAPQSWRVREKMFTHFLKDTKLSDDVDIVKLAKETPGFTGADISVICNEAALIALINYQKNNANEFTFNNETKKPKTESQKKPYALLGEPSSGLSKFFKKPNLDNENVNSSEQDNVPKINIPITMNNFEEAIDKKILKGNKRSNENKSDKAIVAIHEAGHALMAYLCKKPIARATISGNTSGVGGFVLHSDKDSVFSNKNDFGNDIMIAYAGRAAEEIVLGPDYITIGASSDIASATNLIKDYVEKYGFNRDSGLLNISVLQDSGVLMPDVVYNHMVELSNNFYDKTKSEIKENRHLLEILSMALVSEESISGENISKILTIASENPNMDINSILNSIPSIAGQ